MSLSAALEEHYASGGEGVAAVVAVVIAPPGGVDPIRWVTGVEDAQGEETSTIALPLLAGGAKVPFQMCAFRLVRPGADKDGPTDGKLQLDGVSAELHQPLKAAQGLAQPIKVTFYVYLASTMSGLAAITAPEEVIEGLEMASVSVTADMAEGTLKYPDGREQNVPTGPDAFFDRGNYPGLFS